MSSDLNREQAHDREQGEMRLLSKMLIQEQRRRAWDLRFRFVKYTILIAVLAFVGYQLSNTRINTPVADYFEASAPSRNYGTPSPRPGHAALVRLNGLVGYDDQALAENVNFSLNEAFFDQNTRAVILSVDSPGGSPVQAGQIYQEIINLRSRHPDIKLYSVINDLGTSGAYYVAAASDHIYADRASIVGSIGVISSGFGYSKLIKRVGIERRIYSAGERKAALDAFAQEKPVEREAWERLLGQIHEQFIDRVRQGRKGRLAESEANLFNGSVWSGDEALRLGLVDGFHNVGSLARKLNLEVVDYTWSGSLLDQLMRQLGVSLRASIFGALLPMQAAGRPAAVTF